MHLLSVIIATMLCQYSTVQGGGVAPIHRYVVARRSIRRQNQMTQGGKSFNWGPWSTCFNGITTRESKVSLGGVTYSCVQCRQCESQTSQPKPNPAFWASWEAWSDCHNQQGASPVRIRTRSCKHPSISLSKDSPSIISLTPQTAQTSLMMFCVGSSYQTEVCSVQATASWSRWNSWTDCSANTQVRRVGCPEPRGVWESWSVWSRCINTRRFRYRECPSNNCKGLNWESNSCVSETALWSSWDQWSQCQQGRQARRRQCTRGDCLGATLEKKSCAVVEASVWLEWSSWSPCRASNRFRTRTCSRPRGCNGIAYQTGRCRSQVTPVWSSWGQWSQCQQKRQIRSRRCTRGNCVGNTRENRGCVVIEASVWLQWSSWSPCKASNRFRTRACSRPQACDGIAYQTDRCISQVTPVWSSWSQWSRCQQGRQIRSRRCTRGNCVGDTQQTINCVEASVWLEWSVWSPCKGSSRFRTRRCSRPEDCDGIAYQTDQCVSQVIPIWSSWGQWSQCQQGFQNRGRQCTRGNCVGETRENRGCASIQTSMWMEWSEWSSCNGSTRSRSRECSRAGQCNGKGDAFQTMNCQSQTGSHQGFWSPWSSCNGGYQKRARMCPLLDFPCQGVPYQYTRCRFKLETPQVVNIVNIGFGWSTWSQCNEGFRTRRRQCGTNCGRGRIQRQHKSCYRQVIPGQSGTSTFGLTNTQYGAGWSDWGQWEARCDGNNNKRWRRRRCQTSDTVRTCVGPSTDSQLC